MDQSTFNIGEIVKMFKFHHKLVDLGSGIFNITDDSIPHHTFCQWLIKWTLFWSIVNKRTIFQVKRLVHRDYNKFNWYRCSLLFMVYLKSLSRQRLIYIHQVKLWWNPVKVYRLLGVFDVCVRGILSEWEISCFIFFVDFIEIVYFS